MKTGMKVADAMSIKPVSVSADSSIFDVSKLMMKKRVGSLLVIEGKNLKGIFTEKDLVRIIAKGLDVKETTVEMVMVKKMHTIKPDEDLSDAIHHMRKNKVRRLPVVFKGHVVGMLTLNDIIKVQPALFEIMAGRSFLRMGKEKDKYMEGNCELCENFAQLHERNGQFVCAECLSEKGEDVEED